MNEHQLIAALVQAFKARKIDEAAELLRAYVSVAMSAMQGALYHDNDMGRCAVHWPATDKGVRGPLHRCGLVPGHEGKHRCGFDGAEEPG